MAYDTGSTGVTLKLVNVGVLVLNNTFRESALLRKVNLDPAFSYMVTAQSWKPLICNRSIQKLQRTDFPPAVVQTYCHTSWHRVQVHAA